MADGLFPGHPRSGDWETLEGKMLAPHIQAPRTSSNTGDARFNGEVTGPQGWEASLKPVDAPTRGGGTMAK
jgi:hypothetical protein